MTRVLCVAPHPDDESVGCGGTLRRHVVEGDEVRVVFLTSGERGGHGRSPEETACVREAEATAAARILGAQGTEFWREPDGALRVHRRLVARLRELLSSWKPGTVYVSHSGDGHADHRAAARLVARAMSELPKTRRASRPEVLQFEVWTPLTRMDRIIDVTPFIDVKIAAIRAHASQCAVLAFDDAARGLARWRGEMFSWPEGEYAEVFSRRDGPQR